jgi:hypothetical protein
MSDKSEDQLLEDLMQKLDIKQREKQDFLDNLIWADWQREKDEQLELPTAKVQIKRKRTNSRSPTRSPTRSKK